MSCVNHKYNKSIIICNNKSTYIIEIKIVFNFFYPNFQLSELNVISISSDNRGSAVGKLLLTHNIIYHSNEKIILSRVAYMTCHHIYHN